MYKGEGYIAILKDLYEFYNCLVEQFKKFKGSSLKRYICDNISVVDSAAHESTLILVGFRWAKMTFKNRKKE
jgi:hypothetical protein